MKLKAVMLLQGDVDKEFAADGHDLDRCDSIQEDEVSFCLIHREFGDLILLIFCALVCRML
jgi:hypothetical protein